MNRTNFARTNKKYTGECDPIMDSGPIPELIAALDPQFNMGVGRSGCIEADRKVLSTVDCWRRGGDLRVPHVGATGIFISQMRWINGRIY